MNKTNNSEIIKCYLSMYKIRKVEEKISKIYHEKKMRCPVHLSIGQEAIAVGVCNYLSKSDHIFSNHRCHGHYLAKGGSLTSMIGELYSKMNGSSKGLSGSMHLFDLKAGIVASIPIVGSSIAIATGYAWSKKLNNKQNKTAVFFGEGATEAGIFHESLGFASLHDVPILYVCENNLYSVYTHLKYRQSKKRDLKKNVESFGIKYFAGDGNDLPSVLKITRKATTYIKKNKKPAFINFNTYRFLEHCGPSDDDYLNYRSINERLLWKKKCPLVKIENIIKKKSLKISKLENRKKNIEKEIEKAFEISNKSNFLNKKYLNKFTYAK